ncbi:hypothetical protein BX600DRAFT_419503 [Xylariales sp. PMI_506]|nr:hypothetical protein BX600DRAFT_419503 [Xylariales sp. PMI_506]
MSSIASLALLVGIAPQLLAARALQARQSVDCDFEIAANTGDTCTTFAASWGLTESGFESINPGVVCPGNLVAGQNYCVIGTATTTSTTTTTKATTTSTSTSTTSITTPVTTTTSSSGYEPTQSGLVSNCNNFHLVVTGDSCSGIELQYGISTAEFSSWNPAIDSACSNLYLGYYVCVGVPGAVTTTAATTTTTTTATTGGPSPQMPSIVSTCNKYYLVESGDGCQGIETSEGITSAEFLAWNPAVDSTCDDLWLGYYVCVGTSGSSAATTTTSTATTTTTTATGTSPSPQMPSIVSTCNKYYLVQSGDGCYSIEQTEGITLTQFLTWNPYVDSACDNLWLGYYVCVGA